MEDGVTALSWMEEVPLLPQLLLLLRQLLLLLPQLLQLLPQLLLLLPLFLLLLLGAGPWPPSPGGAVGTQPRYFYLHEVWQWSLCLTCPSFSRALVQVQANSSMVKGLVLESPFNTMEDEVLLPRLLLLLLLLSLLHLNILLLLLLLLFR